MTVTVTFTDGTTQLFAGQMVSDWFGGLPISPFRALAG